ncbi:hypothetical protein SEA_WATERT_87 [Microbacterium phage WaterT]|nr:hypothetical protein SEA_WATERT_87 [Microbacterium phage WaterT]
MKTEWEITFDSKNTKAIQALVGRMQNRDGDVDQARFYLASPHTPELGGSLWIEDEYNPLTGEYSGGWADVEVGDTISKIGSMWVPKYGDSPVLRVRKADA